VRLRDIARNRETQARAARFTVARGLEPAKRLEHPLQRFLGDARSFVRHADDQRCTVVDADRASLAVLDRVVDEIRDAALERARPLASTGVCAFPSLDTLEPSSAYSAASAPRRAFTSSRSNPSSSSARLKSASAHRTSPSISSRSARKRAQLLVGD
jgi:hypothetical protein